MSDGLTLAVVGFGFILILALVVGIVIFIVVERRRRKKGAGSSSSSTSSQTSKGEGEFSMKTVSTPVKNLVVNMTNVRESSGDFKLLFNNLSSNPCGNYKMERKDVGNVKNTLTFTPSEVTNVYGNPPTSLKIPSATYILGVDGTKESDVELYTSSQDILSKFPNRGVKLFPSTDKNIKYSWSYNTTNKSWCLDGTSFCLVRDGDSVKTKTGSSSDKSEFDNVNPPTSLSVCQSNTNRVD